MIWHTFDRDRKHLEVQYHDPAWDEESGWSLEQLQRESEKLVEGMGSQPKILIKAKLFEMVLLNGRTSVDPKDWFADRVQHGSLVTKLRDKWRGQVIGTELTEVTAEISLARSLGAYWAQPDFSHTSPDWERALELGPTGLLEEVRRTREEKLQAGRLGESEKDFYDAAEIAYATFLRFALRLAEGADKMAAQHPDERERMEHTAACLRNIATRPPETLLEAMQLAYLYHELIEMEGEMVRSMGGFDRLYYRFYRADIDSRRRTREQQKELIKYFFIKFFAKTDGLQFGKNFFFAGIGVDGRDAVNELSYAAIEAYGEMKTVDPKLSVRVHRDTPDRFLRQVADCIRKGNNSFVLANDDVTIASFIRRGTTVEEARNYTLIGCYEPAIMGKEVPCCGAGSANIAKIVELALFDGVDPLTGKRIGVQTGHSEQIESFDAFYAACKEQLAYIINRMMDAAVRYEARWKDMNPSPLLSATMAECVERGRDISDGGAKYNNTGVVLACIASAVDALTVVREWVYERKTMTMKELKETLRTDWADNEPLRMKALNSREKYGNDRQRPDALARDLSHFAADTINSRPNARGGQFNMGLFSINWCHAYGKQMAASPDGRKAHQPLSKNLCAVTAMDREGVTALINSVTRIDHSEMTNGSVLDVMLHPTAVRGDDGLTALVGLIRSYFEQGGFAIQFNVFDVSTLRDAQIHPENYGNLQVRVCGWSVNFVNLNRPEQDEFIKEAAHLL